MTKILAHGAKDSGTRKPARTVRRIRENTSVACQPMFEMSFLLSSVVDFYIGTSTIVSSITNLESMPAKIL